MGRSSQAEAELRLGYAACEALVAVCAILGNGLVILVFAKERKLRRRTNYYIISLACADLLVGLLAIPLAVLASVGLPRNLHACLLTVSVLVVLCTISIFCLLAVSVDRYWAILHPMGYSRSVRTSTAIGIICACWLAGTLVGLLPLLGWNAGRGSEGKCIFVEVMDYDYLLFLYFATIVSPGLLLGALYAHIYRVVVKQLPRILAMGPGCKRAERAGRGTMLRLLGAARKREVRATHKLSRIVLFFVVCWFPLYSINCLVAFCPECQVDELLLSFCIILSHLNSAGNPLLYAYHLKDFRAALRAFIRGLLFPAKAPRARGGPPPPPRSERAALCDGRPASISIIAAASGAIDNLLEIADNGDGQKKRMLPPSSPAACILGASSSSTASKASPKEAEDASSKALPSSELAATLETYEFVNCDGLEEDDRAIASRQRSSLVIEVDFVPAATDVLPSDKCNFG